MSSSYAKHDWVDDDPATPLNAERLLEMEDGIGEAARLGDDNAFTGANSHTQDTTWTEDDGEGGDLTALVGGNQIDLSGYGQRASLSGGVLALDGGAGDVLLSASTLASLIELLDHGDVVTADEFDDGSIDVAWTEVGPGAGTQTWDEGNGHLSAKSIGVGDTTAGGIFRPLSGFGGDFDDGAIIEVQMVQNGGDGTARMVLGVSDGTSGSSKFAGYHLLAAGGTHFVVNGTINAPFGGSFVGPLGGFSGPTSTDVRYRIRNNGGDLEALYSLDGVQWVNLLELNGSAAFDLAGAPWTPTHVGFVVVGASVGLFSADYIRRIS